MDNAGWYITDDNKKHQCFLDRHNNLDLYRHFTIIKIYAPPLTKQLYCISNKVKILKANKLLEVLFCFKNEIKELNLPNTLKKLVCYENDIKEITLPTSIEEVSLDMKTKITNIKDFMNSEKVKIHFK